MLRVLSGQRALLVACAVLAAVVMASPAAAQSTGMLKGKVFDAKGELTVAGVTNKITMVVNILPTTFKGEKRLEITGSIAVKMTDYKVAPVDINLVLGHIKTGDEVKLVFKWIVGQKKAAAPTATP